jgi:two-component system OmpR family response regulator
MEGSGRCVLHLELDVVRATERSAALRRHGFGVDRVLDVESALQRATAAGHALAVLHKSLACVGSDRDLGLALRMRRPDIGIVLLGPAWEPAERRAALSRFADDCLADDSAIEDLVARLEALARRTIAAESARGVVHWGPLRIDFVAGLAELNEQDLALQPLQLRILGYLIRHAGRVITREELRRSVFRATQARRSSSIARQISVLRKALGPLGGLIATVRGGYGFALT